MSFEDYWSKALKKTEVIRSRIKELKTYDATKVPYVLLSESSINIGDTIVRRGEVLVQKPSLYVPPNNPQFNGFEFDTEGDFQEQSLVNFLLVRGISIPSLAYDNKTVSLDIHEGKLSGAIQHYLEKFQREENVSTGLIAGPEDCWPFSLLIFICTQIARNADQDIRRLLEEYRTKDKHD